MRLVIKMLALFTFIVSTACTALPSDRLKQIEVKADKSLYNYKTGINTFIGHVRVNQGSSHLVADKLVTKNNKQHKIIEATAYGLKRKAHYWTLPKKNETVLHGRAKKIKYYPLTGNISLYRKALITQGENIFTGELVHYNSTNQVIHVPGKNNDRSVLVYNP